MLYNFLLIINMRLNKLKIKNFRGYKDEVSIDIDDLTVFVGKNDIGKSTILEALDIFFNEGKGVIKIDKDDINKVRLGNEYNDIFITCVFSELPDSIIIDATNQTSFESEYLLNSDGYLEVIKKYPNAGSAKVSIKALHPTNSACSNLLFKKQKEYREIIQNNNIDCTNQNINSIMRRAIWSHFQNDLQLQEIDIDASKEDAKNIWEKVQPYLPVYSLFQSDRKNTDGDSEVQDPLKEAVKQILKDTDIARKLQEIADQVSTRLNKVSNETLEKLREMNEGLASSLNPVIPPSESLSWASVFSKVSICGDNDIPINKRGSGVKRLILLNFFRAEAERRKNGSNAQSIIYAFEEPETSQHTDHQKLLIKAFNDLSDTQGVQVLLTTHSATVVKELNFSNIRLISEDSNSNRFIDNIVPNELPYISLNEINYVAFKHITEEYHNELYGYIESEGWWDDYKSDKPVMDYIKENKNGLLRTMQVILTEYIRHQIHHPENRNNNLYTFEQLEHSVSLMRGFILNNRNN